MTQAVTPYDSYLSDFRAFEEALPPGEPAWLRDLRERAFSRFSGLDWPSWVRCNCRKADSKRSFFSRAELTARR